MTSTSVIRGLTESVLGGAPFKVGDVVKHPSGRTVKILSGQYWGKGGLSNIWVWKEIGSSGQEESGYGWVL